MSGRTQYNAGAISGLKEHVYQRNQWGSLLDGGDFRGPSREQHLAFIWLRKDRPKIIQSDGETEALRCQGLVQCPTARWGHGTLGPRRAGRA